jgi:ribose transport system substrate-binding protein
MKTAIRLLVTFLVILCAVGFVSCTKSYLSTGESRKSIEVIVKMKDADFWKTVRAGAEAAEKEFGVKINFNAPEDERDIDGQIALVNQAIERKAGAIVLAASDYKRLVPVAEKAIRSKIPVIVIDSALDSDKVTSFIATDNRAAGKMVAQKLLDVSGEEGNIAIMSFVKGSASADQREEGFLELIRQYPKIKVIVKEYCFSDTKLSSELTRRIIAEHPEVNTIVGLNAMSTEGVAQMVQYLGLNSKVKIIGFDSTLEEIDFMEDDVIQATVVQKPFNMGYLGVKYAVRAMEGKPVPKMIDTGSTAIDMTNLYTPENQKLLFPFVK